MAVSNLLDDLDSRLRPNGVKFAYHHVIPARCRLARRRHTVPGTTWRESRVDARHAQRASAAVRRVRRKHSGMTTWRADLNAIELKLQAK